MKIFTPYRVCPLGAHVDHQLGIVTGFAIDRGVTLDIEPTEDGTVCLTSRNFPGTVSFSFRDVGDREMNWGDFVRGAALVLSEKYDLSRGIKGTVEGTLPIGGLSSSAAVIISYLNALCRVNGISMTKPELIWNAIRVERGYIGVNVGKLDQSCEVYCRKDHLLVLDTKDDSSQLIPRVSSMPPFEFMVIFSGLERSLAGSAYNTRVDECKSAAYALLAFSGMEYGKYGDTYLRNVPVGVFESYGERLPENWRKRAAHYYAEQARVKKGIRAWKNGDLEEFGRLMFESGRSSIDNYEAGSRELTKLQYIMEETDGIYGGRFSGAGFNGSSVALVDPARKEEAAADVREKYLQAFPHLKDRFVINFCKSADGAELR